MTAYVLICYLVLCFSVLKMANSKASLPNVPNDLGEHTFICYNKPCSAV